MWCLCWPKATVHNVNLGPYPDHNRFLPRVLQGPIPWPDMKEQCATPVGIGASVG